MKDDGGFIGSKGAQAITHSLLVMPLTRPNPPGARLLKLANWVCVFISPLKMGTPVSAPSGPSTVILILILIGPSGSAGSYG